MQIDKATAKMPPLCLWLVILKACFWVKSNLSSRLNSHLPLTGYKWVPLLSLRACMWRKRHQPPSLEIPNAHLPDLTSPLHFCIFNTTVNLWFPIKCSSLAVLFSSSLSPECPLNFIAVIFWRQQNIAFTVLSGLQNTVIEKQGENMHWQLNVWISILKD